MLNPSGCFPGTTKDLVASVAWARRASSTVPSSAILSYYFIPSSVSVIVPFLRGRYSLGLSAGQVRYLCICTLLIQVSGTRRVPAQCLSDT